MRVSYLQRCNKEKKLLDGHTTEIWPIGWVSQRGSCESNPLFTHISNRLDSFHCLRTNWTHFYLSSTSFSVVCRCPKACKGKSTAPFQLPHPLVLPFVTGRLRAGELSTVVDCWAIQPPLQALPSHIFKCAVVNILSHASEASRCNMRVCVSAFAGE